MAWYWWVLIVIAAGVIGYFKLKILSSILAKRKQTEMEEMED